MLDVDLTSIFNSLSEIPLRVKDKSEALKKIAMLGREALGSHACTLTLADTRTRDLTVVACDSADPAFEEHMRNRKIRMGSYADGDPIDYDLMVRGEQVEKYGLQQDGQGVANPQTARQFNINSLLSYPLTSEDGEILYFNHFTSGSETFTDKEKTLLQIFVKQALLTIEHVDNLHLETTSLRIINELSHDLLSENPADFLQKVSDKAAALLSVPVCIVWMLDRHRGKLRIVATHGYVDDEYKKIELSYRDPGIEQHLKSRKVGYLCDVTQPNPMFKHAEQAKNHGWRSLLSAPMWAEEKLVGMLNIFTDRPRSFKEREKNIFGVFANQAALSIQNAEFLKESETLADIREAVNQAAAGDRDTAEGELNRISEGELKRISKVIAEKCAAATVATASQLWLFDKATGRVDLMAHHDKDPADGAGGNGAEARLGEDIARRVITDGEARTEQDFDGDARHAGFRAAAGVGAFLCVPIRSVDIIIGGITVFARDPDPFGSEQKKLLERIAGEVSNALERALLADSLMRLVEAPIKSQSLEELVREIAELTRRVMWEPVCLVWLLDKDRNGFAAKTIATPEGQRPDLAEFFISNRATHLDEFFAMKEPLYFPDAAAEQFHPYAKRAGALGWKSMLAMPLVYDDGAKGRRIGILEVYSYREARNFTAWHKKMFATLAVQACIAIVSRRRRKRSEDLNTALQEMENKPDVHQLLPSILDHSLKLMGSTRGWISRLDLKTGALSVIIDRGQPKTKVPLKYGEGLTGLALQREEPVLVDDVKDDEWRDKYKEFWGDTRSELAVPIVVGNARAWIGHKPRRMTKPLGVINIESPTVSAFSEIHKSYLQALASQAAVIIDRLELDKKLRSLFTVQKQIAGKRDWEEILKVLPAAITDILGYDYVNISLVDSDRTRIHTVLVRGIPEGDPEEFKREADHPLEDESGKLDIQADIVRTRRIEVPDDDDPRFDANIYDRYGHKKLIRVFVPMMIPPDNRVIGTVEAGYRKGYRKYIYEQDVQILKNFIDFAILSLEPRLREQLEVTIHEISSSVGAIRSNTSFLQTRFEQLQPSYVSVKLDDLMLDCEVLMRQMEDLGNTFGHPFAISRKEETVVFRDVIIKVIKQLKPIARVKRLDWSKIEYNTGDSQRIVLYLDSAKLNQVVTNILNNSIKYAEPDPSTFRIKIIVEETPAEFVIKFQDWGIGVREGCELKIFDKEFRTPEAIRRTALGNGLGLHIAAQAIGDIGGSLKLTQNRKPTEFSLSLPKTLRRSE